MARIFRWGILGTWLTLSEYPTFPLVWLLREQSLNHWVLEELSLEGQSPKG